MIATIVSALLILPTIIKMIVGLRKDLDTDDFIPIISFLAFGVGVVLLIISLSFGYGKGGDPTRRASIEEALSLGSRLAVHDAIEYNEDIREGDNFFCRFTLRPDSDYIDVTLYENKQGETK